MSKPPLGGILALRSVEEGEHEDSTSALMSLKRITISPQMHTYLEAFPFRLQPSQPGNRSLSQKNRALGSVTVVPGGGSCESTLSLSVTVPWDPRLEAPLTPIPCYGDVSSGSSYKNQGVRQAYNLHFG